MMKSVVSCVAATCLLCVPAMAQMPTNTLWYAGSPTGTHWGNATTGQAPITHFVPFVVSDAAGWRVDGLFTVGEVFNGSSAAWSLRSGMSSGNGGTVLSSGVSVPSVGAVDGATGVIVDIPDIDLAPGTYWLEVTPASGSIFGSNGSNAIGTPAGVPSLRNWPFFSQSYAPYSDAILSGGVIGSVLPTPGAASLLCAGGLIAFRRRR
ncbi:MAG TPA: hypothetical protein VEB22_01950 [Phycisphaerales bacterium]|nr:hypothetical protein [Phycisphaerales bacterium]